MGLRTQLARRILPVPEALVIEADEYLFTLAAAMSQIIILREALTHYRFHGGNLYLAPGNEGKGLRRKQQVMEVLASSFRTMLQKEFLPTSPNASSKSSKQRQINCG